MKFTIITVCFNAEKTIGAAMQSLAAQRFKDFEWLVVDGASRDRTLDIVKSNPDLPLRVISEPDKGIYDAMNKGIAAARGDYVFFLNADDEFANKDVLGRVAAVLQGPHVPDVLVGRIWHTFESYRILRDFSHLTYRRLLIDSICHQATFSRRDLLQRSGGFDLQYRMCADYDWFLRAYRSGAVFRFCDEVVANFSGDGAHVQRGDITRKETLQIRRKFLGGAGYSLSTLWRYLDHYARRARSLAPRGHVTRESLQ